MAATPYTGQPQSTKTPLFSDRLKAAEETIAGMAAYVQAELPQLKSVVSSLVEVLNAIVATNRAGYEEEVQKHIQQERDKRAQEAVEREKKMIASLVEAGLLAPADRISDKSIVIGREFDKEGNVLGTGRSQYRFEQFTDKAKTELLDQGVAFVIEGDNGKFEVTEIYDIKQPPAPEVTESDEPVSE